MDAVTPPKPSQLPPLVEDLMAKIDLDKSADVSKLEKDLDIEGIQAFQRAANYLSVAQIFLQSNALLLRPLTRSDLKPRLLGHFGTCPGIIFVYAHATALLRRRELARHRHGVGAADDDDRRMIFVLGPGHGAPGMLSSLYLEGTIQKFYPSCAMEPKGFERFVKEFSWPGSFFPSHVNAYTPGAIHEGGELGYALSVAYGAVMDKPDMIAVCLVGDGEAETGPTATAWHAHKYIDPAESGMVLPILHDNGYKIAERTIFGTMDDLETVALFTGYGYQVRVVSFGPTSESSPGPGTEGSKRFDIEFVSALEWAYNEIRKIQRKARTGEPEDKPRWPMIVLRSPKGWGGPKQVEGHPLEGNYRSHQVPLPEVHTSPKQFNMLESWLRSYEPQKYFHPDGGEGESDTKPFVDPMVTRIVPERTERRMGAVPETLGAAGAEGEEEEFVVPEWTDSAVDRTKIVSAMKSTGAYLRRVVEQNQHSFRIFSPDELSSNKLDAVFEKTQRNFQWDPETAHKDGRVIEILSEHTLQGFLQGYSLTGRVGLFPSYESFLPIVTTMICQYAKFIKMSKETKWRKRVPSLNYVETSTLWRQEHNGFSHQNPGLINTLLNLPHDISRVYFPPDSNTWLSTVAHCLRSKNYVNLMVGSKNPQPTWLSKEEAEKHCIAGASVWPRYSTNGGVDPDVVLVGIGVETTAEVLAAAELFRKDVPQLKVRVINVTDLMILAGPGVHPHGLDSNSFDSLFTPNRPVVIDFHGYPSACESLLFSREGAVHRHRIHVLGYREEGTTTTPWSMLRLNRADRFSVAQAALKMLGHRPDVSIRIHELRSLYAHKKREHEKYVQEYGIDPPEYVSPVREA